MGPARAKRSRSIISTKPAIAVGFLRNRNHTSPAKVLFFVHIFSRSSLEEESISHLLSISSNLALVVFDSGVNQAVEDIYHKNHDHQESSVKDCHAHNGGVVPLGYAVHQIPA